MDWQDLVSRQPPLTQSRFHCLFDFALRRHSETLEESAKLEIENVLLHEYLLDRNPIRFDLSIQGRGSLGGRQPQVAIGVFPPAWDGSGPKNAFGAFLPEASHNENAEPFPVFQFTVRTPQESLHTLHLLCVTGRLGI
jgi:hypothetical protein